MREVTAVTTGSSAKISAACVAVVNCCAQTCTENAIAVVNTAVIETPHTNAALQCRRAGCTPLAEIAGSAHSEHAATVAICKHAIAPPSCRAPYRLAKII